MEGYREVQPGEMAAGVITDHSPLPVALFSAPPLLVVG